MERTRRDPIGEKPTASEKKKEKKRKSEIVRRSALNFDLVWQPDERLYIIRATCKYMYLFSELVVSDKTR